MDQTVSVIYANCIRYFYTHYSNIIGTWTSTMLSSAMIAKMEQTGSTHSSAEIKRKAISNSMLIIANVLHNLLQMLFTEFLMVYGTLMQKKNSLIPAISPCNMLSFHGKAQKEWQLQNMWCRSH